LESKAGSVIQSQNIASQESTTKASSRWSKIRKIVLNDKLGKLKGEKSKSGTPAMTPRIAEETRVNDDSEESSEKEQKINDENNRKEDVLHMEDIDLDAYWDDPELLKSYSMTGNVKENYISPPNKIDEIDVFDTTTAPEILEITRIPDDVIDTRKTAIERAHWKEHQATIENVKKTQIDVIFRENLARKRIKEMETKTKEQLLIEKTKIAQLALEKEKKIGQKFRKAREDLESGISRQLGAVREHFGKLTIHRDVSYIVYIIL
jgi:hypothetical protein